MIIGNLKFELNFEVLDYNHFHVDNSFQIVRIIIRKLQFGWGAGGTYRDIVIIHNNHPFLQ